MTPDEFLGLDTDSLFGQPASQAPRASVRFAVKVDPGSPNRFLLSWSCGDREEWAKVLEKVKVIPGRLYTGSRAWSVPNTVEALKAAVAIGFNFTEAINSKAAPASNLPAVPKVSPIETMRAEVAKVQLDPSRCVLSGLRSYQVEFLKFMVWSQGRGGNGDDMGTGKTVQALGWLAYSESFPALIVVNAPTKLQWERVWNHGPDKWVGGRRQWHSEFKEWDNVMVLDGRSPRQLIPGMSYIINWDVLADWGGRVLGNGQFQLTGPLHAHGFKAIVGDEVQAIGNPASKRSKAFRALARIIPSMIGMSGTPARSKPAQFWPLLNILAPRVFPNHYRFQMRYCDPKHNGWGLTYNGASNVEELHELIAPLILRRSKAEVMKDLPPKTVEVVPLSIQESEMKEYLADEAEAFGGDMSRAERRERVSGLLRTAYILKERAALDWIKDFLEASENKLLLFVWHIDVVELLIAEFKAFRPAKINGAVTGAAREAQKDRFVQDPSCRLLVANIQAGGVGLDGLQAACSHCAFLEFSHTPNDHRQAEDRLHRGGQDLPVTSYYLVAPKTVDMDAIEVLDRRAQMLDSVLDGKTAHEQDLLTEILARRGF
jgi:SWI/SNF-related matrix-associated actin-dependent regulator 1 of chromatin subfamily A